MENKEIKIRCKGNRSIPLGKLLDFQGNLKELNKTEFNKLKSSILNNGFIDVVKVWQNNENNYILDGHQRLFVIKELIKEGYKIDDIPVSDTFAKDEKEAKKFLLLINSRYGIMTDEGLYEFNQDSGLDFDDWKDEVDFGDLDLELFEENHYNSGNFETVNDDIIPENVKSITKVGDLYELGKHRLLCGDSTKIEDVEKLINNDKMDMVYTDPPYGINHSGDNTGRDGEIKGKKIKALNLKSFKDDTIDYAIQSFKICEKLNIKNQVWWGANYYCHHLPQTASWLVWDKRVEERMRNRNSDCELAWIKSKNNSVRIFRHLWNGICKASETNEGRIHPTQKPIALAEWCFNYFGNVKTILDFFLGSGSTLIAAEKTNRICYGMEIDEYYCDVIVERYKQFCLKNDIKTTIKKNGIEVS